jgi:preprotein translocase subunit SecD
MFRDLKVRGFIIFLVVLAAAYKIYPTYQYYTMSEENKAKMAHSDMKKLRGEAINLGLDLQGGMYVLLEAEIPTLVRKLASKKPEELLKTIKDAEQRSIDLQTDFFDEFETLSNNRELRLIRYYTNLSSSRDNGSIISALKSQRDDAINSVLEIIRNRVDEFGVSEPNIQKYGSNRIIVELAGIDDADRARKLIQRTASLEFTLVMNEKLQSTLESIDKVLIAAADYEVHADVDPVEDEPNDAIDDIFSEVDNTFDVSDLLTTPADILKESPFSGYLRSLPGGVGVLSNEFNKVKLLLEREDVQSIIPRDGRFLWASKFEKALIDESNFIEYRLLYFVRNNPEISGGMVKNPQATIASSGTDLSGQWVVNLEMTPEGARKWSRFTGANIDKQVAIVLDEKIFMAPFIRGKIPGGRTQISGFADANEAKDISNVLRAGELPAPVYIIEERTIGASLGSDSIKSGRQAMLIGFVIVLAFMIFYYRGSGLLANIALILNLVMVIAILAGINATLTLPGIAGLILTIGMAVDANVIIFERIREELDLGKTVKAAIDAGYKRAFITILDANITTLIAAFVLAWIGSGPIKGFAITLSAGIICSMFTAVFVTRTIFMMMTANKPLEKLSI